MFWNLRYLKYLETLSSGHIWLLDSRWLPLLWIKTSHCHRKFHHYNFAFNILLLPLLKKKYYNNNVKHCRSLNGRCHFLGQVCKILSSRLGHTSLTAKFSGNFYHPLWWMLSNGLWPSGNSSVAEWLEIVFSRIHLLWQIVYDHMIKQTLSCGVNSFRNPLTSASY